MNVSCGLLNTAEGTPFAPWKPVSCDASQRPWRSRTVSSESLAVKTPLEIKLLQTARWHVGRAKDRKSVRISRRGAREKQSREIERRRSWQVLLQRRCLVFIS